MKRLALMLWLLCGTPLALAQPQVLASIEPLAMAVREIVGDEVQVETLLHANQTTHDPQLLPSQQRQLLEAPLLLWLGAEAEPALARSMARRSKPTLALLDLATVQLRYADHDHHHGAAHDHDEQHHAAALDGHLWLSLANMRAFAQALIPLHAHFGLDEATLTQRVAQASSRWQTLEDTLRKQLAPYADRAYVSHHDAWGYFYDSMGLRPVTTLSSNTLVTPGARTYARLASRFRDQGIHCVLAEPEANMALLQRLCSGECAITLLDPLGRNLTGQSYSALLQHIGEQFGQCLAR